MATDNDMMIIVMIIIMTIIIITMIIMALASLLAADAHEDPYRCIYGSKGTVKLRGTSGGRNHHQSLRGGFLKEL